MPLTDMNDLLNLECTHLSSVSHKVDLFFYVLRRL